MKNLPVLVTLKLLLLFTQLSCKSVNSQIKDESKDSLSKSYGFYFGQSINIYFKNITADDLILYGGPNIYSVNNGRFEDQKFGISKISLEKAAYSPVDEIPMENGETVRSVNARGALRKETKNTKILINNTLNTAYVRVAQGGIFPQTDSVITAKIVYLADPISVLQVTRIEPQSKYILPGQIVFAKYSTLDDEKMTTLIENENEAQSEHYKSLNHSKIPERGYCRVTCNLNFFKTKADPHIKNGHARCFGRDVCTPSGIKGPSAITPSFEDCKKFGDHILPCPI